MTSTSKVSRGRGQVVPKAMKSARPGTPLGRRPTDPQITDATEDIARKAWDHARATNVT